ncbi:MAG: AAA family ATP:ADP antiporter [Myxococcota bacterium]|jgi:AAA family ATP:ADP antiporter
MRNPLHNIRRDERRDTWAAFLTLFGILTGHSILETARDALFLAKIPAEQLPWVYLGIAALSLVVVRVQLRLGQRRRRRVLALSLVGCALVTGVFWALLDVMGTAGLYALYVWSGVLATLVLVHFWTLLANLFSVSQAKRVFGVIGAGSVLGAIFGSAIAGALALQTAPRHLLLASAGVLLATSLVPQFLSARLSPALPQGSDRVNPLKSMVEDFGFILQRVYARRVVMLLALTAATVTVADYVFKHLLRENVPPEKLDEYLAAFYLVANILSLVVQVFIVNWLTRRFTVLVALSVLPALLLVGGLGIGVIGGLTMAMWVKGADSALRHSLNKTGTELLFFPMGEATRNRVKAFIDVIGQRGGQAVASLGILTFAAFNVEHGVLGIVLAVLAALWLTGVLRLRAPYLELFRKQLRGSHLAQNDYPDLDLESVQTLIAGLDSEDDGEVTAAMDLLAVTDRLNLVPALILFHPSEAVVVEALAHFRRANRTQAIRVAERLTDHHSGPVRAALVGFFSAVRPDAQMLRVRLSSEDDPAVRAAIMVHLIAAGEIFGSEADDVLDNLLANGRPETRIRLAEAFETSKTRVHPETLIALSEDPEVEVRRAAARAIGENQDPAMLPVLLRLIGNDSTRAVATVAMEGYGSNAVEWLCKALADPETPAGQRWLIPSVIGRLAPNEQANQLLAMAPGERDGMVRYHIIRTLQEIKRTNPRIDLDSTHLDTVIANAVGRAYRSVARRMILRRGLAVDPTRKTPGHVLLMRVLDGKFESAIGRLFRTLTLRYPQGEFGGIQRGLKSGDRDLTASSLELLENLLKPPLRGAVVGLVDALSDPERLPLAGPYSEPLSLDYNGLIEDLLSNRSRSLKGVAIYHIGELRLTALKDQVAAVKVEGGLRHDIERTLAILSEAA